MRCKASPSQRLHWASEFPAHKRESIFIADYIHKPYMLYTHIHSDRVWWHCKGEQLYCGISILWARKLTHARPERYAAQLERQKSSPCLSDCLCSFFALNECPSSEILSHSMKKIHSSFSYLLFTCICLYSARIWGWVVNASLLVASEHQEFQQKERLVQRGAPSWDFPVSRKKQDSPEEEGRRGEQVTQMGEAEGAILRCFGWISYSLAVLQFWETQIGLSLCYFFLC